jgi:hypothetical protein
MKLRIIRVKFACRLISAGLQARQVGGVANEKHTPESSSQAARILADIADSGASDVAVVVSFFVLTVNITIVAGALCSVTRALCVGWGTPSGESIASALASAFVNPQNAGEHFSRQISFQCPIIDSSHSNQPFFLNTSIFLYLRAVRLTFIFPRLFCFRKIEISAGNTGTRAEFVACLRKYSAEISSAGIRGAHPSNCGPASLSSFTHVAMIRSTATGATCDV